MTCQNILCAERIPESRPCRVFSPGIAGQYDCTEKPTGKIGITAMLYVPSYKGPSSLPLTYCRNSGQELKYLRRTNTLKASKNATLTENAAYVS